MRAASVSMRPEHTHKIVLPPGTTMGHHPAGPWNGTGRGFCFLDGFPNMLLVLVGSGLRFEYR